MRLELYNEIDLEELVEQLLELDSEEIQELIQTLDRKKRDFDMTKSLTKYFIGVLIGEMREEEWNEFITILN